LKKDLFFGPIISLVVTVMIENIKPEVIEAMLDSMPIEISFVNENDVVSYFNKNGDRIFPRPRSVVGKKVTQCHPSKSVDKVLQILDAFKKGERNVAEFWINLGEKKVYIRYFPVRDKNGRYLGTLEVSQDITNIKSIEGEKRLLDWK